MIRRVPSALPRHAVQTRREKLLKLHRQVLDEGAAQAAASRWQAELSDDMVQAFKARAAQSFAPRPLRA